MCRTFGSHTGTSAKSFRHCLVTIIILVKPFPGDRLYLASPSITTLSSIFFWLDIFYLLHAGFLCGLRARQFVLVDLSQTEEEGATSTRERRSGSRTTWQTRSNGTSSGGSRLLFCSRSLNEPISLIQLSSNPEETGHSGV